MSKNRISADVSFLAGRRRRPGSVAVTLDSQTHQDRVAIRLGSIPEIFSVEREPHRNNQPLDMK